MKSATAFLPMSSCFENKMWYLVVSKKKKLLYLCEDGIEQSVPRGHSLSSLASLMMPISNPGDGFLYPNLTRMMDSYIHPYTPEMYI